MTADRLATILSVDVVGYSHILEPRDEGSLILAATRRLAVDGESYPGLIRAGGEGMLERLNSHRRQLVDRKFAEHHGRVVKTAADGILVEFAEPVDGVRCAVEIQRGMAERNAGTAADKRIIFRIGIDLGDPSIDVNRPHDAGMGAVARLEGLAEPGGVCISGAVREIIRGKLPYPFEDIGERTLKNGVSVHAYAIGPDAVASTRDVGERLRPILLPRGKTLRGATIAASIVATTGVWIAAGWVWFAGNPAPAPAEMRVATGPQAPPAADIAAGADAQKPSEPPSSEPSLSIIVLPFANRSSDLGQEYFADGITEDLTVLLSRIPGSVVIARNTAFAYKDKSADAQQIGRELDVRYVLEGSVRRAREQVRLNVLLIDTETGKRPWGEQFDTDRASLADTQNEIIGRLAHTLDRERGRISPPRSGLHEIDPDAHDLIMRGRAWSYRPYSPQTWQEAQTAFEQALEIDPRSVEARVDLASVLGGRLADGWSNSRQQDPARAELLLREALERDANRSTAHFAMGVLRRMQNRLPEAPAEFETAIALNRNDARAFYQLGVTLMFLGRPEEGIPHLKRAIRLDPNDPDMTPLYWALGTCHLLLGQADEAIDALGKARAANSRVWYPYLYLAGAFGFKGDIETAKDALAQSLKLKPEINSLARMRAYNAWINNPQHWTLQEETLNVGLRRAGLSDE
jgi:TolB-like protein/class 3 adenylate cyclase/tetratricopeptide (TPR) repeat protein